jgi:hypothetical protein
MLKVERERNWKNITRESSSDLSEERRVNYWHLAASCDLLPACGLQTSPNNALFLSCGWRLNRGALETRG